MRDDSVSVIIPTFNREATLERAIRSVIDQTHAVLEVIVIDDGSADGTTDLVNRLSARDERIRLLQMEHGGAGAARNAGIAASRGALIAFQDSDDEWHPDLLARLVPLVGDGNDTVAFSSHRVHYRDGTTAVVPAEQLEDVARRLLTHSVISLQTALIPGGLLRSVRFDEGLARFQDWALWLTLVGRGDVHFIHSSEIGAELYRLDDSISEGSTKVRSQSLRRILRSNRELFLRHPVALARILVRAYLRPGVASKHSVRRVHVGETQEVAAP